MAFGEDSELDPLMPLQQHNRQPPDSRRGVTRIEHCGVDLALCRGVVAGEHVMNIV
ncbi:unannotated protein [freshwater metagenome]|uniref:Unannotated protein n=1 Tax=freshwater metagenome TaxID=449393 RepID=A0A6J7NK43_9ZZZZ